MKREKEREWERQKWSDIGNERDRDEEIERQKKSEREEKRSEKQGCDKLPLVVLEVLLLAAVNL